MALRIDFEVAQELSQLAAPGPVAAVRGDWRSLRTRATAGLTHLATLTPPVADVTVGRYTTSSADGATISLRWYRPEAAVRGPAVVYAHGGGKVAGSLDLYQSLLSWYSCHSKVPFLGVEYRLAPEFSGEVASGDVFAAIEWLIGHADQLGVDPQRVAVMGDSGGGAPAAGAAILAREHGIAVAKQILIYPMLDDRTVTAPDDPAATPVTWSYDDNFTAWRAALGAQAAATDVSPLAAPARLTDHAELAAAYLEVGDIDILCAETVAYASALAAAKVPIELHVHPGAPHGWDRLAPGAELTKRTLPQRLHAIAAL